MIPSGASSRKGQPELFFVASDELKDVEREMKARPPE
jgi:hypothetical protein